MAARTQASPDRECHETIVIGAGPNGLYALHRLREAGVEAIALEAAEGVGGTWYWNRYPGARLDSECFTYGDHFSRELVDEWDWKEYFADQPTLEEYFNFVADRLDLRRSIRFNQRVTSCTWREEERGWDLDTGDGRRYRARFVVAVSGLLSRPHMPDGLDMDRFAGRIVHSSQWPAEGIDLTGKRVGVLGVGSTGIQIVQSIAGDVAQLTVFQRTANWATPLNNGPLDDDTRALIKATADEIHRTTMSTNGCFLFTPRDQLTSDVTAEEREAVYESRYADRGMSLYQGGFKDVLTDRDANRAVVDFLTRKIYQRVRDPEVARKLIPDHGYATRRPPLETGYFEVYNRDNVRLVHLPEEPITRVTENGIETARGEIELDVIILATGFDAITGSFVKLGIQGVDGETLADHWSAGPRTLYGVAVSGFPNLFIVGGPQGAVGNIPRCCTFAVEWTTECIVAARAAGHDRVEALESAEEAWTSHCRSIVESIVMLRDARSWMWGSNVAGKPRGFGLYIGPQPELRARLAADAAEGYSGFRLSGTDGASESDATGRSTEGVKQ
jgi:cation diffusion facilitator CzcD-associated flavoprotein CzcO